MSTLIDRPRFRPATAAPHPEVGQPSRAPARSRRLSPRSRLSVQILGVLYVIEVLVIVSIMPLSAVLLFIPAAMPDESVIAETVSRVGLGRGLLRRQFNLLIGLAAFVAFVAFAGEIVVRVGLRECWQSVGDTDRLCARFGDSPGHRSGPVDLQRAEPVRPLADIGDDGDFVHGRGRVADLAIGVRQRHVRPDGRQRPARETSLSSPTARPTSCFRTSGPAT